MAFHLPLTRGATSSTPQARSTSNQSTRRRIRGGRCSYILLVVIACVLVASCTVGVLRVERRRRLHALAAMSAPTTTTLAEKKTAAAAAAAAATGWARSLTEEDSTRSRARLVIGVFTREGYEGYVRREAMRKSGAVPRTAEEAEEWESARGIAVRFIVGGTARTTRPSSTLSHSHIITEDMPAEDVMAAEERIYGEVFLRLNVDNNDDHGSQQKQMLKDDYTSLPLKSYRFFERALKEFPNAMYIAKVDDDVYIKPMNLFAATLDYARMGYGNSLHLCFCVCK